MPGIPRSANFLHTGRSGLHAELQVIANIMDLDQYLSQDWLQDAKYAYKERVTAIESGLGECMQECCRRCATPSFHILQLHWCRVLEA